MNIYGFDKYPWQWTGLKIDFIDIFEFQVQKQSLTEYLQLADEILGKNSTIRQWLLTKETSRNKYCKLAEFIHTNDWNLIHQRKKIDRPTVDQVCLPQNDLISYFSSTLKTTKKI